MGKNSKQRRELKKRNDNKKISLSIAKVNRMMYEKPNIFFDESGNTGGNLLDSMQPFFTLSSCSISKPDALPQCQHSCHPLLKMDPEGDGVTNETYFPGT